MDKSVVAKGAWLVAAGCVAVAVPLVFANAGHEATQGRNEELGMVLFVAAAASLALVAWARGLASWPGRTALAGALAVPVLFVVWLVVVSQSAPAHPFTVRGWAHVADAEGSVVLPAGAFPRDGLQAMLAATPGETGCLYFPKEADLRAFEAAYREAGGEASRPGPWRVVVEGRAFEIGGAVPCPI